MALPERVIKIRLKIERPKKHINDLNCALQSFLNTRPYTISKDRDPQTSQLIYKVASIKDVPVDISIIAPYCGGLAGAGPPT